MMLKTGLMHLAENPPEILRAANLGLLCNQASVGPGFEHAVSIVDRVLPGRLKALFGPQHGFAGEKQDNMIESDHGREAGTDRPIYSLYGEVRRPTVEMLAGLDVLLVDLVDVGTRVYTFAQTMAYCLETAAKAGVKVMVLDRPNPIGGTEVEGNLLQPDCASFVGMFPIPMRHGLTIGELARFMADHLEKPPELEVVPLSGWSRDSYFPETGLPWVMPSPNMPGPETAWVYPGQVIWEGTNISEGRGTTRPFNLWGAPFIDPLEVKAQLEARGLDGAVFRPVSFEPTFHKHQGRVCLGLDIHPTDPRTFRPYLTSLTILEILLRLYPDQFSFNDPPYEYEFVRRPIDLILGDKSIREGLEAGLTAEEVQRQWTPELNIFLAARNKYLMY